MTYPLAFSPILAAAAGVLAVPVPVPGSARPSAEVNATSAAPSVGEIHGTATHGAHAKSTYRRRSVYRHKALRSPAELRVRAANRAATEEPQAHGFVNAMQIYAYDPGVLYRLMAAPERVTDIALQPGEAVTSVAAGDTVRWTVGDTTSGSGATKQVHVLVKPFAPGLATNLIITTDRRTYHLQLASTASTAMAGLSWTYPADAMIALRGASAEAERVQPVASGIDVETLDFAYAISGDRPAWRPLRVFDDGRQTFIEFPASIAVGEAPPLFVVDRDDGPQLVNYRMRGRYYVVDRLFDKAELRLGTKKQAVVRIVRSADVPAGRRGGRKS